jgi:F0F1-type ATP synthase epsilon subunit
MFEDQKVELLPERTTMVVIFSQNGNTAVAAAVNAGNINVGGNQANIAAAAAAAGSNFFG